MKERNLLSCGLNSPLLNAFYYKVFDNEYEELEREVPYLHMERAQKNIDSAIDQLEYLELHKDFQSIKAESVNRFVANEQLNLKRHIQQRATNLLNAAKGMENRNRQEQVNAVLAKALEEVDKLQKNIPKSVIDASFDAALDGIRAGAMDYKNDVVLPMILEKIKGEVNKIKGLSQEQQKKLVALTEGQLQQLRNMDEQWVY